MYYKQINVEILLNLNFEKKKKIVNLNEILETNSV